MSLEGCGLAFILMFVLHIFGAMGAGDVKLFAAIGSVTGAHLVLPMFFIVMMVGLILAVYSMIRANAVRATMIRVVQIFLVAYILLLGSAHYWTGQKAWGYATMFAAGFLVLFLREDPELFVISTHTVRTHVKNAYRRLGVHSREEAERLLRAQRVLELV